MVVPESLLQEGKGRLVDAALPNGGFGYHRGGQPFVEPTALALLALAPRRSASPSRSSSPEAAVEKSLRRLISWQNPGGFFGAMPDDPDPSCATAPALLALLTWGEQARAQQAARWLAEWKTPKEARLEEHRKDMEQLLRIDVTIEGWPWLAGEFFATVEPTALVCIALKAAGGTGTEERIREGLRYFGDRACASGGWNYGTPYFRGKELSPITLPTAKGLLAVLISGLTPSSPIVVQAVAALSELLRDNPSRKAHAWGALAYSTLGDDGRAAEHARLAVDSGDGGGPWGGGTDCTALAVLALRAANREAPDCLSIRRV